MNTKNEDPDSLVVIDATAADGVAEMVSKLRSERPERRIVVTTLAPDWRSARAAFEAGAIDYVPIVLDEEKMKNTFREILARPLPPWPR